MNHLFAYGTLMCEDIMQDVSGCRLSQVPAWLSGYSRRPVKNEPFPAALLDEKGCIEGVIYLNVPDSAWNLLDRFEGAIYTRRLVQIDLNDGKTLSAMTYVIHPEFDDLLEASDWDFATFLKNGKTAFQKNYKGYRSLSIIQEL